ncbi:MAG: recombinase family protein [Candidatus Omnitrophota bacterium]
MKAILYARVSSKEQEEEGYSIDAQKKLLHQYAISKNIKVVKEFIDVETAKKAGRESFGLMLQYLQKNADTKTILCEKTDRLYRNFKDYVIVDELDLEIHLVKENEILSKDSRSHQKFIHGIKVLMAKNYVDNLSEETKKGLTEKAEQGIYPSHAPLGYKNCSEKRDGREIKYIEVDTPRAAVIQKLFSLYATGNYSLKMITKTAYDEGLRTINGSRVGLATLHKTLHSPFYYGAFTWAGKLYEGTHKAIVSKELFDIVQEAFGSTNKPRMTKKQFAYSGLMVCGQCGCAITAEIQKGKYVYYHCTGYKGKCQDHFIREEELAGQFTDIVKNIHIDDEKVTAIKQALLDSHKDELAFHQERIQAMTTQKSKLESKMHQLYDDRLEKKVTEDFYTNMMEKWQEEMTELKRAIAKHENADSNYLAQGIHILELCNKASALYLRQKPMERAKLLRYILLNCTLNDRSLCPTYRSPFNLMVKEAPFQQWGG